MARSPTRSISPRSRRRKRRRVKPFVRLPRSSARFLGQLTESAVKGIRVVYEGKVRELNTKPMTAAAIAGVLRPFLSEINMVNAAAIAKDKGIVVDETHRETAEDGESRIKIYVEARTWCGARGRQPCCRTGCRASPRSATSRWTPSSRRTWSMCATPTSRLHRRLRSLLARRGQYRDLQPRPQQAGRGCDLLRGGG